jgi:hypothetical protein
VEDEEARETPAARAPVPASARRTRWDFALMVATTALLGALGVQSLLGTLYAWWAQRSAEDWTGTTAYGGYIGVMNAIAGPLLVALIIVMGLCVPKRLFSRWVLVGVSAFMVALGVGAWLFTGDATIGMAAYLMGAAAIQVAVVMMTMVGSTSLAYLTEGRVTKVGSGMLHLGFIIFAYVVVALQKSGSMLTVFWLAAALCLGGTALSFYAGAFTRALAGERQDAA